MRYTGLELLMEKLQHMIYSNDNPHVNNHPSILSQRPQFQLLYEELGSMIQTLLFVDEHYHDLQQATDLQKRFKGTAQDAHDIIDLFVYTVNLGNEMSLHLEDVIRSIKSIKEEFMAVVKDNTKIDSSPRTDRLSSPRTDRRKTPSAVGASRIRNPRGTKKVMEDIVVGFDRHVELIRDKLVEDQKHLDVVSIVGMGGLGKTTLANKVFNDPFVVYHFHVRGWVTVSQTYEKHDLLIQILESIGVRQDDLVSKSYCDLRNKLHKGLMGQRYLIVIDDIWSTEAWDDLKLFFPDDHTQSRIMLTSRLNEVALRVKSHGFIHRLESLTEEESWELLCKKVFPGDDCPKSLIGPGTRIAKNCHGLPLSLVVVAGVLSKEKKTKNSWERISQSVSSYNTIGYIEVLSLSFDHLPSHLRDCFLYLGGFPEDHTFRVPSLIRLWVAEGFIQQEERIQSLEEIAKDYLMELVDRNLVVIASRKSNGGIKAFRVHDLLRELCVELATKENFFTKINLSHSRPFIVAPYKQRRVFVEQNISIQIAPTIRSLLCFHSYIGTKRLISNWSGFWMLVMVLDLRNWELDYFPEEISQLVHLRYLAVSYDGAFPSSICSLWNLQTLVIARCNGIVTLPHTISNLVNLRYLHCSNVILFPFTRKPLNLETISMVVLGVRVESWVKCFPGIKKLTCLMDPYMKYDFDSLSFLESLSLRNMSFVKRMGFKGKLRFQKNHIGFPSSLKELTLEDCYLSWNEMSIIQSLPNLEVLKLLSNAFVGPQWDAGEEQFQQLKFLKLSDLEIERWEASDINFPCLRQLVLKNCFRLDEIPLDIGYIPTLEHIDMYQGNGSAVKSLHTIRKDQEALGNFELKINIW